MKSYGVKQRKETSCVPGSERYTRAKDGRLMIKCVCKERAIITTIKTRFVKSKAGSGIVDTLGDPAMELFIQHGIPWHGKKAVKIGRYYGSEFLRQPRYQKMIANKAKQLSHKGLDYAIDTLSKDLLGKASDKLRPKDMKKGGKIDYSNWYATNVFYQRGEGIPIPFPFVDWKKAREVLTSPGLCSSTSFSPQEEKVMENQIDDWKRQYKAYKNAGGSKSYGSWIKWKGYGKGLDIHNAILKVAPKKGFVMPGHRYTGPGNPLHEQLKYDPNTGQILEIYQQSTGKTDAVAMQHDVDYSA